eukprot:10582521-Alexandrium_andersonii.AAC.1
MLRPTGPVDEGGSTPWGLIQAPSQPPPNRHRAGRALAHPLPSPGLRSLPSGTRIGALGQHVIGGSQRWAAFGSNAITSFAVSQVCRQQ